MSKERKMNEDERKLVENALKTHEEDLAQYEWQVKAKEVELEGLPVLKVNKERELQASKRLVEITKQSISDAKKLLER